MSPSFADEPDRWERYDWQLLQNGFITAYWAESQYRAARQRLLDLGYKVVDVDTERWDHASALGSLATAVDFPRHLGGNLDALRDCLRDVADGDYGSDPDSTGTVLALDHFDAFHGALPDLATSLLDMLADTGRLASLVGRRFIVLVRSSDPEIDLGTVGGLPVQWNPDEWVRSRRGL